MRLAWNRSRARRALLVATAVLVAARVPVASSGFASAAGGLGNRVAMASVYPTANTVVVNSTGDTGDASVGDGVCWTGSTNSQGLAACTLRAALQEANASAAVNRIAFSLPAAEAGYQSAGAYWQISPTVAYPPIIQTVTVDGTTQTGSVVNTATFPASLGLRPAVRIDSAAVTGTSGLSFTTGSGGSLVKGLSITGFVGSGAAAVRLDRSNSTKVAGNLLGSAPDGTVDGNAVGVEVLANTASVKVGSPTAADRNLITASAHAGVVVRGSGMSSNLIQGNVITGAAIGTAGIIVANGAAVTVGGTAAGTGNQISGSAGPGVAVDADTTNAAAAVLGNQIVQNAGLGIDLWGSGGAGVTPNDAGDADSGPDALLNFPVVTATSRVGTTVTVDYTLDVPAGFYRIELFVNPSGVDATGYGEGEQFVKGIEIFHAGGGSRSFSTTYTGAAGDRITMTASTDIGDFVFTATSEFSGASAPVA